MSNILFFILFIGIVSFVWLGGHYYLIVRVSSVLSTIIPAVVPFARLAILSGAFLFLVSEILTRYHHLLTGNTLFSYILKQISIVGTIWGGVFSIAITLFLLRDVILIISSQPVVKSYTGYLTIGLIIILSIISYIKGNSLPDVVEYIIPSKKLPPGKTVTFIHLSDLHINYIKSPESWLKKIVSIVNAHKPDIVVITGDIIDVGDLYKNGIKFTDALKEIKPRYGIYAVSGNHEYYAGYDNFVRFAEKSNITIIDNKNIFIPLGDSSHHLGANGIFLLGIPDDESARFRKSNGIYPDFDKAIKGVELSKKFSILLSHRPSGFQKHSSSGIDLQLSGHLHAGQIPPMDLIIYLAFKYPWGLYKSAQSYIYTTSGTSIWGPPMRLFSRNEIVKFIIRGENS